jgi:hypothetical protein
MSEVQGSIVVRRVRQGDTITTRLESDKALYQGITDGGWLIAPDWTVVDNQPTITPKITTSLHDGDVAIVLGSAQWKYNGSVLTFGEDGICTGVVGGGTMGAGLFHLTPDTGALKIIGNLAASSNTNVDRLRFDALVNTGYETQVGADIDVRIELVGKNSYTGVVDGSSKTFKEGLVESITATARLTLGITTVTGFKTEWYKDDVLFKAKGTDLTCAISRSDVDGSQIFICNFYVTIDGSDKLVSSYLFVLYDGSDPYMAVLTPIAGSEVTDSNTSVQIKALLKRRSDGVEVTASSWEFQAYNCRAQEITLVTAVGDTSETPSHKYVTVTDEDCDDILTGETETNGDVTIAATATL